MKDEVAKIGIFIATCLVIYTQILIAERVKIF